METNQTTPQPLIDTLTSLQQWAINSMQYVKRRNHLGADEKKGAYQRLEGYGRYLRMMITNFVEGTLVIQPEAIPGEIKKHLQYQTMFNQWASHYEFPRYPLPDSIPSAEAFDFFGFKVSDNSFNDIMQEGDHLMGKPVYAIADLKPYDLLVIMYRADYRQPRRVQIGWFRELKGNNLILEYGSPRLVKRQPDRIISMYDVVRLFSVLTISRNVV